jgi:hypothetical protein
MVLSFYCINNVPKHRQLLQVPANGFFCLIVRGFSIIGVAASLFFLLSPLNASAFHVLHFLLYCSKVSSALSVIH